MFIIWGSHSEHRDLGVVAELCPRCGFITPCTILGRVEGIHIFFLPILAGVSDAVVTCGRCLHQFQSDPGRYKALVPSTDALSLSLDVLLDRTNPELKERLDWSTARERFSDDQRFEEVSQALEELRPGSLKTRLTCDFRCWEGLSESQRDRLCLEASELARLMRFALSIGPKTPTDTGFVMGFVICLAVWAVSYWIPPLWNHGVLLEVFAILAGPLIGGMVYQFITAGHIKRWTHEVLVPECRKTGIDLQKFSDLLGDLPPSNHRSPDALTPLQDQAVTILEELSSSGKIKQKSATIEGRRDSLL